jgi:hypothetical protein
MDVASLSLDSALTLFSKFKPGWTIANFARFRGFRYRNLSLLTGLYSSMGNHLRNLVAICTKPGVSKQSFGSWYQWLSSVRVNGHQIPYVQNLVDRFCSVYKTTEPFGYDPSGGSDYQGYFQSSKDSIWDQINLDKLEGGSHTCADGTTVQIPFCYFVEELRWLLHSTFYPIKSEYKDSIRQVDKLRPVGIPENETEFNSFVSSVEAWMEESSLVPKEKTLSSTRDVPIKPRAGRWLKWWSFIQNRNRLDLFKRAGALERP